MNERIGVGIVTCNRQKHLQILLDSLHGCNWLEMIVINDGEPVSMDGWNYYIDDNDVNLGVGKSKNRALRHLLNIGCDHIFLIEDDIFVKDPLVFQAYINASKKSGIQHFNYSQHGIANKNPNGDPSPRYIIDYDGSEVAFYPHCVGAFSYYSRKCLEECGLMDEKYYNACEHVDHTYEIIKKCMHPPFWHFADIQNSWKYLGDDGWSIETSSICSAPNFRENVNNADQIFVKKHGHLPIHTPMADERKFYQSIKEISKNYVK